MHPHANPSVIALWVRHPQSKAIEDDTYYGDASELSERGMRQVPYIAQQIEQLKPDIVLCSPAVRTMKIVFEGNPFLSRRVHREDLVREWPRADRMRGRLNSEPEVEQYLRDRFERFAPGQPTESGEESFKDVVETMDLLELKLHELAFDERQMRKGEPPRATRIVIISHGNRGRQFKAWTTSRNFLPELDLSAGFDALDVHRRLHEEAFLRKFREAYLTTGINPGGFMPPLWHGRFFRDSAEGWNVDEGWDCYLPEDLRDSEI